MSEITIFGPSASTYVRTARWACAEKRAPHQLKPIELGSAAHRALHPFGKVPIMQAGGETLIETLAIVEYIERAFDGEALTPADPLARARAYQWVSVYNAYLYSRLIADYVLAFVLPELRGESPDREAISAAVPEMTRGLEILEEGLGEAAWFAGANLSIADLFLAPAIAALARLPESSGVLARQPRLGRWMSTIGDRPAWRETSA